MSGLIASTSVEVIQRIEVGIDRYGASIYEDATSEVLNVIPQPGGTENLDETRPEGVTVDMTFHFPKNYTDSLKGARIRYSNHEYRVIGDPQPYLDANTPGDWNRAVETEVCDG